MMISPDEDGWYHFKTELAPDVIDGLSMLAAPVKLKLTGVPLVTVKFAKRLAPLKIDELWLWSDVTRRAMRYLIQLPELREVNILCIRGPGAMANFSKASRLEIFRANHFMTEADLLELTRCETLREIGAQNADLTVSAMSALLALPQLTTLDLEATRFDDRMARWTSRSTTLQHLDLGATRLTGVGLAHLVRMRQLRSLDLWATDLDESDLRLLSDLPELEYLSIGNVDWLPSLDPEKVTALLLELPKLKRVWLDGIHLEAGQRQALEAKLEYLRAS